MIRKRVPIRLFEYGMIWVTDGMVLTYTTAKSGTLMVEYLLVESPVNQLIFRNILTLAFMTKSGINIVLDLDRNTLVDT